MSGSNNNNSKSDVGFILFLILVVAVMVPFFIGFDNFDKLIQISKIIIIVFSIIAIIASGIFGYIYFKRKTSSKRTKKPSTESADDSFGDSYNESNLGRKNIQKIDLASADRKENILDTGGKLTEIDAISNDLRKINQKYDF